MKKRIVSTIALIALISSQGWAQDVKVYLAGEQETTITEQQFEKLKQISTTIQEMLADVPEELKSLYLPGIDRTTFDLLMQVQGKTGDALRSELNKLSDAQIYHLMNATNYLNTREVLDATALIAARLYFRDKHINQLLTEDGYKNYYEKLELIPDLQTKIAQQFTKLPLFSLFKEWAGRPLRKFDHGEGAKVVSIAFNSADSHLATGSSFHVNVAGYPFLMSSYKANIFNIKTGEQLQQFEHEKMVTSIAFDPAGQYLATGSDDKKARIFDIETGEQLQQFEHEGQVYSVAFNPTGHYLATGSYKNKARIFDLKTGKQLQQFEYGKSIIKPVVFDPTVSYLATVSENKKAAHIYDLKTGKEKYEFEHGDVVRAVVFDSTGRYLATRSDDGKVDYDGKIRIFDLATGDEKYEFKYKGSVTSIAFDSTGNYLATGSTEHRDGSSYFEIRILDIENGEQLQQITYKKKLELGVWILSVAFDPSGNYLAVGSYDNKALIWIFLPTLEKTLQELTLKQAQVITLAAKKIINPSALPNHLKQTYASLPEVVRLLLEKNVGQ